MTLELQDELLRRALLDAAAADFAGAAEEVPMSPRQRKRMRAMTADPFLYVKKYRRPWWRQAAHTAAVAAVTLGLSVALLSALSPTVRAAIKQWFMELRQSDIVYYFTGEPLEEELPYYTITELPEGFAYAEEENEDGYRSILYTDSHGRKIYLDYSDMATGSAFVVDMENTTVQNITVNGYPGQIFISMETEQTNGIAWVDEGENIQFYIDAPVEDSVLMHMAESVSLVKTEKP